MLRVSHSTIKTTQVVRAQASSSSRDAPFLLLLFTTFIRCVLHRLFQSEEPKYPCACRSVLAPTIRSPAPRVLPLRKCHSRHPWNSSCFSTPAHPTVLHQIEPMEGSTSGDRSSAIPLRAWQPCSQSARTGHGSHLVLGNSHCRRVNASTQTSHISPVPAPRRGDTHCRPHEVI